MKKVLLLLAAAGLVVGSSTASLAKSGKSKLTPGHKMQRMGSVPGHPGASGYAPGHLKQSKFSRRGPGASGYAPGRTTTGSGSMR